MRPRSAVPCSRCFRPRGLRPPRRRSRLGCFETSRGCPLAEEIAHAVLAAERLALSFGITAIADNTFAPSHLAKMAGLSKADKLRLRVTSRSFGPMPITKMLMKSMGGSDDPRIRFFGDKFFVDRSMSDVGSKLARMAGLPFVTKRRSSRRYSASLAAMGSLAIGNGVPPPTLLPTWVIDTGAAVVNSGMDPLGLSPGGKPHHLDIASASGLWRVGGARDGSRR